MGFVMKKETLIRKLRHNRTRMLTTAKWIGVSVITGCVVGLIASIFALLLNLVTELRILHPQLLLLLPVGAVVIVALYRGLLKEKDPGTDLVLSAIHSGDKIPLRMAPLIFLSTLITHLCGGSAGREGAALQLGGSIGNAIGKWFHFTSKDRHIIIMCGMSAAFSALFGTPIAAAVFSLEVVSVGIMHYAALLPSVISSLIARAIALAFSLEAPAYEILNLPAFSPLPVAKTTLLALLCGLVSMFFCILLHQTRDLGQKFLPNPYLRALVGGSLVLLFTFLAGSQDYNGIGTDVIAGCMEGNVAPEAFLLKMVFTAVTLAAGYKGGEIVPTLFVGASFGCLVGGWLDLSPSLGAAVGMGALFCGVTNAPITSLLLCLELFGMDAAPFLLLSVAVSYTVSGYYGLYNSQRIVYSKYKSDFINKKTE